MKNTPNPQLTALLNTPIVLEIYLSEDPSILQLLRMLPPEKNLYQTFLELKDTYLQARDKHIETIVESFPEYVERDRCRDVLVKKLNDELRLPLNSEAVITIIDFLENESELTIEKIVNTINDYVNSLRWDKRISQNAWIIEGYSPLHLFAEKGEIDLMERAVKEGNPIDAINSKNNKTPLLSATEIQQVVAFEWLIRNGANPAIVDLEKNSILHFLVNRNNAEMLRAFTHLFHNYEQALLILNKKLPHLASFFDQFLPLLNGSLFTESQLNGLAEEIKSAPKPCDEKNLIALCTAWFNKNKLNIFKENKMHNSPFFNAIYFYNFSVLNYFLFFAYDLNIKNYFSWDPLVYAIFHGKKEALKHLSIFCVKNNLRNIESYSLIPFSIFNDDSDMLTTIIGYGAKIPEDIGAFLQKPEAKFSFKELHDIRDQVIDKHCQDLGVKVISKCLIQLNIPTPDAQGEQLFYFRYRSYVNSLIEILKTYFKAPESYFLTISQIEPCAEYLSTCLLKQSNPEKFFGRISRDFISGHLKDWQRDNLSCQGQLNADAKLIKMKTGSNLVKKYG